MTTTAETAHYGYFRSMTAAQRPGVFALEGDWADDLRHGGSMRPVFDLLASQRLLQLVHRDVGTTAELEYYAQKLMHGRYKRFRILHLAFHGNPGKLWVGDDHVDLEQLADLLGEACSDRLVHFGSCSTMRVSPERLAAFKEQTGAVAVSGYLKNVGWIESCAFEMILFDTLTRYKSRIAAFKYVQRTVPELVERLGWHQV